MGDFHDLAINVVASIVFVAIGLAARAAVKRWRTRSARRFWGHRVGHDPALLFLGTFPQHRGFEPSGLVGVGDTRAVYELTQALTRLGVRMDIAYSTRITQPDLERDLILLGGSDVNGIFAKVNGLGRLRFRFEYRPPWSLVDLLSGERYTAESVEVDLARENDRHLDEDFNTFKRDGEWVATKLLTDYGILARLRNPFNPRRTVFVVAGLYGYGTWGGARLVSDADFLSRVDRFGSADFECLFKVEIMQNLPVLVEPVELRLLGEQPAPVSPP